MALVIDLKPNERLIVGEALITNDRQRTRLHIDGHVPIVREKDIMRPDDADTVCKKLYVTVLLMYVGRDPQSLHDTFFALEREIRDVAPSMAPHLFEINEKIIAGSYYQALKAAKRLIDVERELLAHV
jgi:flagellar protein FlbT